MELTIKNATSTVSTIENMLIEKDIDLDVFAVARLGDCLQLYREGVTMMLDAIGAFYSQRYRVANLLMTAAMDGASTCDDGFGGGGESPLSKQYYDLFQLSDVALCIIRLASLVSSSN
ncbi:putative invertase inhibitor [Impatiens glandulifera]|uniref:putative invertase inhibitor n=1 Tax=Impatiens glandulifera TaxID=253017 RepID=UPI001FB04CA0|nr:putative invertase inhibitor [Impatiens glandulifera]